MSTELEIKMRVEDFEPTRAALKNAGAEFLGRTQEVNSFFDRPENELLQSGSGLRIRMETPLEGGQRRTRITFKGPRPAADAPRREVEFMASDHDSAVELFEATGFAKILRFEKVRESWTLGGCEVELDELPELGRFVEIEGDTIEAIQEVRKTLSLQNHPLIKEGYAEMMGNKVLTENTENTEKK